MNLNDIIERAVPAGPWEEGDKIPWHEPGFSERMLREHLSQDHDAASRRLDIVERQVAWIQDTFLACGPSRVLDLGCGPGLYAERFVRLGHECVGIDISPASITYARSRVADLNPRPEYRLEDIREAEFGTGFDLAVSIFGEFNVFRPCDAEHLLRKMHAALEDGGALLIEMQAEDAVRTAGHAPPTWHSHEQGLFSAAPHLWLEEHFWDEKTRTDTARYLIIDAATGNVNRYAGTTQAYTEADCERMLTEAGFTGIQWLPSLTGMEDPGQDGLVVVAAKKESSNRET